MIITLDKESEEKLVKEAASQGMEPEEYAGQLLTRHVQNPIRIPQFEFGKYKRPTETPAWVYELQPKNVIPDNGSGIHPWIGAWPGDETEEELLEMAQKIDDEDAGRV